MNIIDIINKKKNKEALSKKEIEYVVNAYVKGEIQDYQMSSLLMAICINGMNPEETTHLTLTMRDSGVVLNFSKELNVPVLDKHSTGGVGDKVTLIILPILAAMGIKIFKMSGKGLGHTGGTIDKLESIKGYKTDISIEHAKRLLQDINVCLISQSEEIALADKKIYALRDVSGTVDSIPLIAASIMSKKLASGVDKILLEVTYGSGALVQDKERATLLAKLMVEIAKKAGKEAIALLTSMDEPLGRNVGNSLEVVETIEFLNQDREELNNNSDLKNVVFEICAQMMKLAGIGENIRENKQKIVEIIVSGKAYSKFIELVKGQGGYIKSEYLEGLDKTIDIPIIEEKATCKKEIYATTNGYIQSIKSDNVGRALIELKGGRKKKEDVIDHSSGLVFSKKIGDKINDGESILTIYYNEGANIEGAIKYITDAIDIKNNEVTKPEHKAEIIY